MMNKNIVLMSHNDLDGYTANLLLAMSKEEQILDVRNIMGGTTSTIINVDYKTVDKILEDNLEALESLTKKGQEETEFHVVDLGMNPEQLEKLNELGKGVTVRLFDHHISSIEGCESGKYPNIKFQTYDYKCGSMIYYDWLKGRGCFDYLSTLSSELLEDYLYSVNQHDLHCAKPLVLSKALGCIPQVNLRDALEDILESIVKIRPLLDEDLLQEYEVLVGMQNKRLLKALKSTILIDDKGKKYISLRYRDNIDYLSDEIFSILKDLDYLEFVEDGVVSLRGNKMKGYEVLPIAKSHGGGGHPFACGYRL